MLEAQVDYTLQAMSEVERRGAAGVEVRRDVEERFNDDVQRRLQGSVWNTGGCVSWYFDRNGRNSTLWPGTTLSFRRELRRFDPTEHVLLQRAG
jgi:hypothetical protein